LLWPYVALIQRFLYLTSAYGLHKVVHPSWLIYLPIRANLAHCCCWLVFWTHVWLVMA